MLLFCKELLSVTCFLAIMLESTYGSTDNLLASLAHRRRAEVIVMAFEEKAVRTVIEVLHDGEKGFQSLGEEVQDQSAKSFFLEESRTRSQYANELESVLTADKGKTVTEGGTASGALHRTWGELKSKLGANDHSLLETAEQGEDAAKKVYEELLKMNDLPGNVRSILQKQQSHIFSSHDKVKAMRDSMKAA